MSEKLTAEDARAGYLALLDSILFVLDDAPQRKFNIAPSDERALRAALAQACIVVRNATFLERQVPSAKKVVLRLVRSV